MIDNKILSLPVYDPVEHMFTRFVDILDIVAYCINKFTETQLQEENILSVMQSPLFECVTCGDISDLSSRSMYLYKKISKKLKLKLKLKIKKKLKH